MPGGHLCSDTGDWGGECSVIFRVAFTQENTLVGLGIGQGGTGGTARGQGFFYSHFPMGKYIFLVDHLANV